VERVFCCGERLPSSWVTFLQKNDTGILWRWVLVCLEVPRGFSVDLDVFVGSYVLERIVKQYKKDYFGNLC